MSERKYKFSMPSIGASFYWFSSIALPGISRARIPLPGGIYMGGGKLIVGSLTTVALGFIASMFVLISSGDQEITFPMVGAKYEAPSMIGSPVVDAEFPMD